MMATTRNRKREGGREDGERKRGRKKGRREKGGKKKLTSQKHAFSFVCVCVV